MRWSVPGQRHRIYFQNRLSYNQFQFDEFKAITGYAWRVQSLSLNVENVQVELPPLAYPAEPIAVFVGIAMAEVIPLVNEGYADFTITPALPEGIVIDSTTGWLSGTPQATTNRMTYTITANQFTGGISSTTIELESTVCQGDYGLMSVRIRADAYYQENTWTLYEGRGTSGKVLGHVDYFPVKSSYYYLDFCLANGLYTFKAEDKQGDGWKPNTGYTLTVDEERMEIEVMELPKKWYKPIVVSTVFSTFMPFVAGYSEWKVFVEKENIVQSSSSTSSSTSSSLTIIIIIIIITIIAYSSSRLDFTFI